MGPPNTLAGVSLDERDCLTHLPVFAAVNRIASDMGLLDAQLHELVPMKRLAVDHPVNYLLTISPNGEITADRWRMASVGHVLTWGNAYSEIEYDAQFRPCALHILDPSRMRPMRSDEGRLYYHYQPLQGGAEPLPPWKVLHFAGLGFDGLVGYSPIALARETLALGKAADLYGAGFFGNAARPSGMLTSPQALSDNARKNLRESFAAMQTGPTNTGRMIVGEEGLKWEALTLPPDEAQFLETRKMSVEDAARLYGLPPHKIGGDPAGGGIEEQNIDYLQSTILGMCNTFEGELTLKLLNSPAERGRFKVSHDFSKLLKVNAVARAQYNATAIQWGWADRNRIAEDEGYEPFPGGERRLLPLNMQMIDENGNMIANAQPTGPATPTTQGTDSSSTNAIRALEAQVKALTDGITKQQRKHRR